MALACQKAGCERPASHALQIGCGTFTDPEQAPPRAKILMGVLVCEPCLDDETAERWLELNGQTLCPMLTLAMSGGPPPDFSRAVILGVPLESAEYRALQIAQLNNPRN